MNAYHNVHASRRRILCPLLLGGMLLSASFAHGFDDERVVVKKTDRVGNDTYEAMTRSEFREQETACRADSFYSVSALLKAQRAWKEDPSNKGTFPRSVARAHQARIVKSCRDPADADGEVQKYTKREAESAARRDRYLREKCTRIVRTGGSNRGNNRGRSSTKRVFDQNKYNKEVAEDKARKATLEKASQLYDRMLEQCRQEAGSRPSQTGTWW